MNKAISGLVDTHCHLDFQVFDENRDAVREAARSAGVTRIVNPGIDLSSSRQVFALAERCPEVYAAVGVHPTSAETWTDATLRELRELAAHPKVVAIGEIGLDYYWNKTPHAHQKRVLRSQLELAAELGLPVILHSRDSNPDLVALVCDWQMELAAAQSPLAGRPGVLHAFSGDEQIANQVFAHNFWIGIGGPVTFRNAPELQALVAEAPLERLVLETDAPFLSPHPFRGNRNEPGRVRLVAEKIADLKQVTMEDIAQRTTANAGRLFQWRELFDQGNIF